MTTEILERPEVSDPDLEDGRLTHIISRDDEMRGYVLGEMVEALCGHRFVPSRDPRKYPVCQACKDVLQNMLMDRIPPT